MMVNRILLTLSICAVLVIVLVCTPTASAQVCIGACQPPPQNCKNGGFAASPTGAVSYQFAGTVSAITITGISNCQLTLTGLVGDLMGNDLANTTNQYLTQLWVTDLISGTCSNPTSQRQLMVFDLGVTASRPADHQNLSLGNWGVANPGDSICVYFTSGYTHAEENVTVTWAFQ